jgi:hypothetical protein
MSTQRRTGHWTTSPYASITGPTSPARQRFDKAALKFRGVQLRLSDEAVQRGLNSRSFQRWLEITREPFYQTFRKAVRAAVERLSELTKNFVNIEQEKFLTIEQDEEVGACFDTFTAAINHLAHQLESLKLPKDFRGRMRVNAVDPQTLLSEYETVHHKARQFLREHDHFKVGEMGRVTRFKMLDAFLEEDPRDLHWLENRRAPQFAKAVVARRYGIKSNTVHKHLIVARDIAGRPRLKSRLRPK